MNTDIRLKVSFLNHRKRKKLQRALGAEGVLAFIDLMLSSATNRPDGILSGLDKEDIALDAQWSGDPDKFVSTLLTVGLLDTLPDGSLAIHDWQDHNAYASDADVRSDSARFYNLKKYYPAKAKELEALGITTLTVEEYARFKAEASGKVGVDRRSEVGPSRDRVGTDRAGDPLNVPLPDPVPDPEHAQDACARVDHPASDSKHLAPGQANSEYSFEFLELAEQYPRKDEGLHAAWIAFKQAKAAHVYPGNPIVLPLVVQWRISPQWTDDNGRFVPSFSKWIRERRWEAGPPEDEVAKVAKQVADMRALRDSKKAVRQ